jgi:hypothetical protein
LTNPNWLQDKDRVREFVRAKGLANYMMDEVLQTYDDYVRTADNTWTYQTFHQKGLDALFEWDIV